MTSKPTNKLYELETVNDLFIKLDDRQFEDCVTNMIETKKQLTELNIPPELIQITKHRWVDDGKKAVKMRVELKQE